MTILNIWQADNGMMVEVLDEENPSVEVYEDTHIVGGNSKDNIIRQFGKLFYSEVEYAMEELICNKVKVKIEITKQE